MIWDLTLIQTSILRVSPLRGQFTARANPAVQHGETDTLDFRSLPARPVDADATPFAVWRAERLARCQGGELCPSEGPNAFLPVMRTKAKMPTAAAPRIENTICHGWEGMVCFRMP